MKELEKLTELENGTVVLEVYTPTCAGCKKQVQIIEKIEEDYPNISFVKTNAFELGSSLVEKYDLSSAPAILIFKDGEMVKSLAGLQVPDKLKISLGELM